MMRCFRGWAAFLTLFLCISAAGESVFVSSSTGDDANSGLSAESPLRTIEAALKKPGDVFLKAGDIFYGSVVCRGRNLSRYGEGANPVVSVCRAASGNVFRGVCGGLTCAAQAFLARVSALRPRCSTTSDVSMSTTKMPFMAAGCNSAKT